MISNNIKDINIVTGYKSNLLDELNLNTYHNKDFEKTIKILADKEIGDLSWIEYRELKKGAEAFKQIHDGSCSAPKIVLLPE